MREKSAVKTNIYPPIVCQADWDVVEVKPLKNYRLEVSFLDKTQGFIDMSALVVNPHAGIFSALKNPEFFNQVYIEYGVITWPGEIDLAPDAMHDEIQANGTWVLK